MPNLKEKLERLNRLKGVLKTSHTISDSLKKVTPVEDPDWPPVVDDPQVFPRPNGDCQRIELCLPGRLETSDAILGYLKLRRQMSSFWTQYEGFHQSFQKTASSKGFNSVIQLPQGPEHWCFMDIETCGFSNCPVFLIGVAFFESGHWILEQYFARDYDEEGAVVNAFWKILNEKPVLITFNGKRFDMPFLNERSGVYGIAPVLPDEHIDIYYTCRKFWKGQCPNYRLQTLETQFCRRARVGDIPGSKIPEAYHAYVSKPSAPQQMADTIHHNALDLITMIELINIMATKHQCIGEY